jgi:hypothetical protein
MQNYADIRMKVPQALYDKLVMRYIKNDFFLFQIFNF